MCWRSQAGRPVLPPFPPLTQSNNKAYSSALSHTREPVVQHHTFSQPPPPGMLRSRRVEVDWDSGAQLPRNCQRNCLRRRSRVGSTRSRAVDAPPPKQTTGTGFKARLDPPHPGPSAHHSPSAAPPAGFRPMREGACLFASPTMKFFTIVSHGTPGICYRLEKNPGS